MRKIKTRRIETSASYWDIARKTRIPGDTKEQQREDRALLEALFACRLNRFRSEAQANDEFERLVRNGLPRDRFYVSEAMDLSF